MLHYRKLSPLFLTILLACGLGAQDFPYQLDWGREATIVGIGGALSIGSHVAENQIRGLRASELSTKRRRDVWVLDRSATYNKSEAYRSMSDKLLRHAALLPATLMLGKPSRKRVLVIATLLGETMLLNDGLTKASKVLIRRDRPLTYNPAFDAGHRMANDARQSFVSGHTSNTAALSFFTAKVFHDLYPESPWRPVVWAGAAAIPLWTGYARYRAGKHFPTDIAAGYALGAALGILIPQWHKSPQELGWSIGMNEDGLGLCFRW